MNQNKLPAIAEIKIASKTEAILSDARDGKSMAQLAEILGMDKRYLYEYRQRNPDFALALEKALLDGAFEYLDRLRREFEDLSDDRNPGIARVKLEAAKFWLEKRFPKVFGARMAIEVEHKVDISAALAKARQRVESQVIDGIVLSRALSTDSQSVDAARMLD